MYNFAIKIGNRYIEMHVIQVNGNAAKKAETEHEQL